MKCPECGEELVVDNDELVCYSCGYFEPAELSFDDYLYDVNWETDDEH